MVYSPTACYRRHVLRALGLVAHESTMTEQEGDHRKRGPRKKRPPRIDSGKKIVVRVTPNEFAHLQREAGEVGVSAFVRASLFGGGVRSRDVLRAIAALHVVGISVKRLADAETTPEAAAATLKEVRAAIAKLATLLPKAGDATP